MAKAKEVATQTNFSDERPDYLPAESVRGQENVGVDDLTIPRLGVIQDLSPQHKESKPEYIEGAKAGMLFNNVTSELYDKSVIFVPVYFRKEWVIWKLQSAGGGFEGAFDSEDEAIEAFKSSDSITEETHEVVDMAQHFGMLIHENRPPEEIVISMSKSKLKVSRQLNTLVKMAGGDRFSKAYKISAVEDQNNEGQDYHNFGVTAIGFVSEPVYNAGIKMYENIAGGIKDVNRDAE